MPRLGGYRTPQPVTAERTLAEHLRRIEAIERKLRPSAASPAAKVDWIQCTYNFATGSNQPQTVSSGTDLSFNTWRSTEFSVFGNAVGAHSAGAAAVSPHLYIYKPGVYVLAGFCSWPVGAFGRFLGIRDVGSNARSLFAYPESAAILESSLNSTEGAAVGDPASVATTTQALGIWYCGASCRFALYPAFEGGGTKQLAKIFLTAIRLGDAPAASTITGIFANI